MTGSKIRINRIIKHTGVEGFGMRYCIWVQGCSIRCQGCKNQDMWPFEGGTEMETESVIQDIRKQTGLEGVTVLGGEPLDQKKAVADILKAAKAIGLSTIVFTGYEYKKRFPEMDVDLEHLLKYTDLLIDGPFKQGEKDFSRPWVGSRNQRYLFFNDRYKEEDLYNQRNRYEVRIFPDGNIKLNGMGDLGKFDQIMDFR